VRNHKLRPLANAGGEIIYAGGLTGNTTGTSHTYTFGTMTGGTKSSPEAGDCVVICLSQNTPVGGAPWFTAVSSGWTKIGEQVQSDSNTTLMACYIKIMGGTPDTDFQFTTSASTNVRIAIQVFEGVDQTTPQDATATSAKQANTGVCDPAAITTVTNGAFVVVAAAAGMTNGVSMTAPSGYTGLSTSAAQINQAAMAHKEVATAGSENPGTFGGEANTQNSACSYTLALRPA